MYSVEATNSSAIIYAQNHELPFAITFRDTRYSNLVKNRFKMLSAKEKRIALSERKEKLGKIGNTIEFFAPVINID